MATVNSADPQRLGSLSAILSWGRGIGSASGMYFLEPLIFANIPAFLWFGYYGWRLASVAQKQAGDQSPQPTGVPGVLH
jgi:hypothetical protein